MSWRKSFGLGDTRSGSINHVWEQNRKEVLMPTLTTEEKLETAIRVAKELKSCGSPDEVRRVFKDNYMSLGWKVICRMFVLDQEPERALKLD